MINRLLYLTCFRNVAPKCMNSSWQPSVQDGFFFSLFLFLRYFCCRVIRKQLRANPSRHSRNEASQRFASWFLGWLHCRRQSWWIRDEEEQEEGFSWKPFYRSSWQSTAKGTSQQCYLVPAQTKERHYRCLVAIRWWRFVSQQKQDSSNFLFPFFSSKLNTFCDICRLDVAVALHFNNPPQLEFVQTESLLLGQPQRRIG